MTDEALSTRLPTHERRLDNGLTVLIREDHSAPVVAIVTHVKAGYFNEPDRLVGISHVLEHMYFKGTERRGAGEMAQETKAAGGYLNAGTIYDYTSYYTVLPSAALELGLDIQADALCNSEIDEDELRKELRVIVEESKRKLDNPAAVATETLYEEMFDVHRMQRWRMGTEEELMRLTREDVWSYYRNLYHPSNIVLVIAGDVDPERTMEYVERFYGDMPAGEVVREASPEEPARREFRYREMSGDIAQTYLEIGWRTPATLDPDTPVLDLLSVVLGQGRASRLYRGVREPGWATGISAYNYTPTEVGVFGVGADLSPDDLRSALEATWRELSALRRDTIDPAEMRRAKNIVEARVLRRTETVESQANLLADWQALGDWRMADRYLERLRDATAEDLRRVADRYLALDRTTVLVYRPEEAAGLEGDAADVEAMLEAVGSEPPRSAETAGAAAPAAEEPAAAPSPPAVSAGRVEDGVHLYDLDSGVRLAIRPRRTAPLVSMGIGFTGGVVHETPATAEVTAMMGRLSVKGTEQRSAARIAEEAEALGGAISPSVSSDLFNWTIAVPSRHFDPALDLLADVALHPAFPEEALERERKAALSELEQSRDDMFRYPLRLLLQGAFGGHPYGFPVGTLEDGVESITTDDLRRWHRDRVLRARPVAFIVGDVDPDRAAARVAGSFDALRGEQPADGAGAPEWPSGPREEAERREKAQTALMIGFPGPARNDPDLYAVQVLTNAISGLGGRLFEELRSRRSLAYTVAAYPLARRLGGAIVGYIATSPEREDEARRGLLEQFERLTEETLDREEVERARRYTIGAWKIRSQTNNAHLSDLAGALLVGEGLVELREFESRIRSVTPVRIREVLRRCFDPNRLVEGIVRGVADGG